VCIAIPGARIERFYRTSGRFEALREAAALINKARKPILLLEMRASGPEAVLAGACPSRPNGKNLWI
jgi:hypothetical protein